MEKGTSQVHLAQRCQVQQKGLLEQVLARPQRGLLE
jgi:hypothetical protein